MQHPLDDKAAMSPSRFVLVLETSILGIVKSVLRAPIQRRGAIESSGSVWGLTDMLGSNGKCA